LAIHNALSPSKDKTNGVYFEEKRAYGKRKSLKIAITLEYSRFSADLQYGGEKMQIILSGLTPVVFCGGE